MRMNEAEQVVTLFRDHYNIPLVHVNAEEMFLGGLEGQTDPEKKRKTIGKLFIDVFEARAKEAGGADFLAQGTLYPDVVESGGGAGTVAVNGATTTNILDGEERAEILDSQLDNVGNLSLSAAEGDRTIWGLGAVVNGAGTAAVGAANVNNIILAKRVAKIDESAIALSGTLNLSSGGDALIRSAALGGGGD